MRSLTGLTIVPLLLALSVQPAGAQARPACSPDNAGLKLPAGFCALIVADKVGSPRHMVVAENGDLYVGLSGRDGGVLALRDTTGDGVADVQERFGPGQGGTGVALRGEWLYFATDNTVIRYRRAPGVLRPSTPPETIVGGLPARPGHSAKSIAFGPDGKLYVNVGSPSNSCQVSDRSKESPGKDPCPELETRAGIWRFDPDKAGQAEPDGMRYATGLRNVVALVQRPGDGALYGVVHGRDQLFDNWGKLFNQVQSAELPAEILVRLDEGDDYGWPYCYYDQQQGKNILNPEYGGDGKAGGRCEQKKKPLMGFPGHWAPDGALFYTGTQFPATYRNGLFIAFHGSWNRAPEPQAGYKVVFVPFAAGQPSPNYATFADGFAGPNMSPSDALHRPVGMAQGPDGSLYVTDDRGGRIYRIMFRGAGR